VAEAEPDSKPRVVLHDGVEHRGTMMMVIILQEGEIKVHHDDEEEDEDEDDDDDNIQHTLLPR
jgi:hypothetical protein